MLLPGSYANGFAPRDGRPLYPELWTGCVFAVAPCLGVSGLTLRDWGGYGNHGTLTNGPTWAASQGKYAIKFDGVNDYIQTSLIPVGNLGTSNATIVVWAILPDVSTYGNVLAKRNNSSPFQQWQLLQGSLDSSFNIVNGKNLSLFWYAGGSMGNTQHIYTTANVADGNLHCIVARRINGTTPTIWIDGIKRATTTVGTATSNLNADSNTDPIRIGSSDGVSTFISYTLFESRLYQRALSDNEIQLLATRRGIAYEMAPRRRSQEQVTTNRRRRIIIGANR